MAFPIEEKWKTLVELVWDELGGGSSSAPIFWLDEDRHFRSLVAGLVLPREIEIVTVERAFRLRIDADELCVPLENRLLYFDDRSAMEPLAEIMHCFGNFVQIEMRGLLRQAGVSFSADVDEVLREYPQVVLSHWDELKPAAFGGDFRGGVAAAICGSKKSDAVDIAIAFLRSVSLRATRSRSRNLFDSVDEAGESLLLRDFLKNAFGFDAPDVKQELLRVAVIGDLRRQSGTCDLVPHLYKGSELIVRLAERIATDTVLLNEVQGELIAIASTLNISLGDLDTKTLLDLPLIPEAHGEAIRRVQAALLYAPPATAFDTLREMANIVHSERECASASAALRCHDAMNASQKDLSDISRDVAWFVDQYAASWHQVDGYYRHAMRGVEGGLESALRTQYRQWLREVNNGFTAALAAKESWVFAKAQREKGKSFSKVSDQTAILVMDALRLEMAHDIVARLGKSVEVDPAVLIASMPSITEVGMSALTPCDDPMRFELKGKTLRVFVGNRETNQKSVRDKIWEAAGFKVLEPGDVALLSPNEAKVVVFHGAVDAIGEKLQGEFFKPVEALVDDLANLIRKLLEKGFEVVATADHGFLTLPADSSGYVTAGVTEDEVKKRRYRVAISEPLEEPVLTRSAQQLGFEGDVTVGFPPAASILSAHGALTFLHGGISLQELVIPCFTIRAVAKKSSSASWKLDFPTKLAARVVRVSVTTSLGANIDKVLRLGIWRDEQEVSHKEGTSVNGTTVLSVLIPEHVTPGPLRVSVSIARGAVLRQVTLDFKPERG